MSTGVDWLLHIITVLVGTVSQMSTSVDFMIDMHVRTVAEMSTDTY